MLSAPKHALLPLLFFTLACTGVRAQCEGSLGENIFTDGDFGSGTANILQTDPGIAPGFSYERNPPPNDGLYTITNDMRRWAMNFGTWDAFADNSNDPNGYMMIVNSSFEPGLFYEQRVTGLCEDTEYQFTADLRNIIRRGTGDILPNVSFLIDGDVSFSTGDIPEEQTWNTYGFSFRTTQNQTEVVLALRNNAPGGIGNDLAIDNIEFRPCGPVATVGDGAPTVSYCFGGPPPALTASLLGEQYPDPAVQWQESPDDGLTWVDVAGATDLTYQLEARPVGRYRYRYLAAGNATNLGSSTCRIVSDDQTVLVTETRVELADTICAGLTYDIFGQTYSETGIYRDTLFDPSGGGCDTIISLALEVIDDSDLSIRLAGTDPLCPETPNGGAAITDILGGAPPYQVFFEGMPRVDTLVGSLGEGTHRYRVEDRFGCAATDSVTLTSRFSLNVELGGDRRVVLGEPLRLSVSSDDTVALYRFDPPLDCGPDSNCAELTVVPTRSGVIRLNATSVNGCVASDSIRVEVVRNTEVYAPSAFSPNADGVNDFFLPLGDTPRLVAINNFRVFSRWGQEMFYAPSIPAGLETAGWDGRTDERRAPAGVYLYVAEALFLDGTRRRLQGNLTLIR